MKNIDFKKGTIRADMPDGEYRSVDAVSNSQLKLIDKSPFHYKYFKEPDKESFQLGRIIHCLVLEGSEVFNSRYIVTKDRRTAKAKQEALDQGKELVTYKDYDYAEAINNSLKSDIVLYEHLFQPGATEVSMFKEVDGINMKGRLDLVTSQYIVDLKKINDISENNIQKQIYKFGYHVQAYMYSKIAFEITGILKPFIFLFVEDHPPYDFKLKQVSDTGLDLAEKTYYKRLEKLSKCVQSGNWPSRKDSLVQIVEPPAWFE